MREKFDEVRVYPIEENIKLVIEKDYKNEEELDYEESILDSRDSRNIEMTLAGCEGTTDIRRLRINGERVYHSNIVPKPCSLAAVGSAKLKVIKSNGVSLQQNDEPIDDTYESPVETREVP